MGFAPGGRASLALPRAILRVAAEKAGAGMHRLGFFGQDAFTGMGFPTAPLTKKARCLSTANFLLTRDSVGIRQNRALSGRIGYFTGPNNVV